MIRRKGLLILISAVLAFTLFSTGRQSFLSERPPAFFVETDSPRLVELGSGFDHPGIHHFSDGERWLSVMELTNLSCVRPAPLPAFFETFIEAGRRLDLYCKSSETLDFSLDWMSAGKRMALGISLHPDLMKTEDWEALPGLGPHLAEQIESDRQVNGDFGSLEELKRVKGIGPGRISKWKEYFNIP